MFSHAQETDWEYIDCVLIPDHASDRIGAVLFWNDKEETSNVAFFDADGYFQQCGTYAKMSVVRACNISFVITIIFNGF